jgi:hypothetical protein
MRWRATWSGGSPVAGRVPGECSAGAEWTRLASSKFLDINLSGLCRMLCAQCGRDHAERSLLAQVLAEHRAFSKTKPSRQIL